MVESSQQLLDTQDCEANGTDGNVWTEPAFCKHLTNSLDPQRVPNPAWDYKLIGDPKPTKNFTTDQLKSFGIVGIYNKEKFLA